MSSEVQVVIDELYQFPIKSCAPVRVDALCFDDRGVVIGDREWVVVDDTHCVVWQGSHPALALVHPRMCDGFLELRTPLGDAGPKAATRADGPAQVRIWNDATQQHDVFCGTDAGDEAARFLREVTGAGLRLVRLGIDGLLRATVQPVHLVTRESHQELVAALGQEGIDCDSVLRLRPNVVVSGLESPLVPFLEEHFISLEGASDDATLRLDVRALCARCVVPNVDPKTGVVTGNALQTIAELSGQRHPGQPVYFGIYARPTAAGSLKRGATWSASLDF